MLCDRLRRSRDYILNRRVLRGGGGLQGHAGTGERVDVQRVILEFGVNGISEERSLERAVGVVAERGRIEVHEPVFAVRVRLNLRIALFRVGVAVMRIVARFDTEVVDFGVREVFMETLERFLYIGGSARGVLTVVENIVGAAMEHDRFRRKRVHEAIGEDIPVGRGRGTYAHAERVLAGVSRVEIRPETAGIEERIADEQHAAVGHTAVFVIREEIFDTRFEVERVAVCVRAVEF